MKMRRWLYFHLYMKNCLLMLKIYKLFQTSFFKTETLLMLFSSEWRTTYISKFGGVGVPQAFRFPRWFIFCFCWVRGCEGWESRYVRFIWGWSDVNLLNYLIFTNKEIDLLPLLYEFRLHVHFVLAPVPIGEVIFVYLALIG